MKVGLVEGCAQSELFNRWFPNHRNTIIYDCFDKAFVALERDEVDLVMASQTQLLVQTNYHGLPGFKANIVFNYPFESTFGFHKDEAILCSIIDKALHVIDTKRIADRWTHKTYDYRVKVAQSRLPWLRGTVGLLLCVIVLVVVLFHRSRKEEQRLIMFQNVVMETMAGLVEYRDAPTGGHIERTSHYLEIMINELLARGLYKDQSASWNVDQMVLSAQLHDVGKIAIDDSILNKPGKLTKEEFEKMKRHTIVGNEIIERIQKKTHEKKFLDYAKIFALYHHERWDGNGYPYGLKGEEIPLPARLMAIIDVYDALVSKRSYKEPFSHEEATRIITEGSGSQFDPILTGLFLFVAGSWDSAIYSNEQH
jgi:HD-GYP domain-containing protein (c-di-GMP phosphodiesterase class II)